MTVFGAVVSPGEGQAFCGQSSFAPRERWYWEISDHTNQEREAPNMTGWHILRS